MCQAVHQGSAQFLPIWTSDLGPWISLGDTQLESSPKIKEGTCKEAPCSWQDWILCTPAGEERMFQSCWDVLPQQIPCRVRRWGCLSPPLPTPCVTALDCADQQDLGHNKDLSNWFRQSIEVLKSALFNFGFGLWQYLRWIISEEARILATLPPQIY